MKGKIVSFLLILALFLAVSCGSGSAPQQSPVEPRVEAPRAVETPPPAVQPAEPTPQPVAQLPPPPPAEPTPQPVVELPPPPPPPPPVETFVITQEYYASTLDDVREFIEELNAIIRNRNYNAWRAALSQEYYDEISSPENLRWISEQPAMLSRRIVLRNAEDYFINVVVPSRANSRVDDIEFVSMNRVKAFTVNTNRAGEAQYLRLYDLEKIGNSWKIIN